MKGPWRALLVQGSSQIFNFLQPDPNEKNDTSGSKDWLDPKPGPKFEFGHCLKVYKKHDHERTLAGPPGPLHHSCWFCWKVYHGSWPQLFSSAFL